MELYHIHRPQGQAVPIVANLPHSGLFVPEEIGAQMLPEHLRSLPNSDWHLDRLYAFLPQLGITVLQATYSRYVVDLNREAKAPLFGSFWSAVVPETTAFGQPIYHTRPDQNSVHQRIEAFYRPYHQTLTALLREQIQTFGFVYLLDLHSFLGLIEDQVCLGNQDGRTCSQVFLNGVETAFRDRGYQVVKNKVFKGGYITKHYARMPRVGSLQIEIRYPVYLKAEHLDRPEPPNWNVPEFETAQRNLEGVFAAIVACAKQRISSLQGFR